MGLNLQGNIIYIKRSSGLVPIYSLTGASNSNLGILGTGSNSGTQNTHSNLSQTMSAEEYLKLRETTPSKVILIKNMCTMKELEDDDEYDDLYDDVLEECKNYGKVIQVKIPRAEGNLSISGLGKVFVEYYTREGAAFAKEHLNGKSFHGRIVEVVYHPEDMLRKNLLD
jgi:RNA recognition motif-containing protein